MRHDIRPQSSDPNAWMDEAWLYLVREVCAGFLSRDEMAQEAADVFADAADAKTLASNIDRMIEKLRELMAESRKSWPKVTDCQRLDKAFADLDSSGIIARQHFARCTNCGRAEIRDEIASARAQGRTIRGYVFFHFQDTERALNNQGLLMTFGSPGHPDEAGEIAKETAAVLSRHGLHPNWNGDPDVKIFLPINWKRCHPSMAE